MGFLGNVKKELGPCKNFKYLDDLIHSGTKRIVLDLDIVLDGEEESDYKDGIKLNVDDLVIDGNGHTIDAQGKTSIFHCTGKNITIKNIKLKNGFSSNIGGAIFNEGELKITESTLNNNLAKGGGAIYNYEGRLTVSESIFTENTAHEDGGAIYNRGELKIMESSLINNLAKKGGGAIFNGRVYGIGELTISDSKLTGNTAQKGGAIYNNKGTMFAFESALAENTAQEDGGAIYNDDELKIMESSLNNNLAKKGGGAIYDRGMLIITESTLQCNTADSDGAIYSDNEIIIANCTLINNLQSFSFVGNNDKYDIKLNDNLIPSKEVRIYLDNKCDGEYPVRGKLIEWNRIISSGNHELLLKLKGNNKIIMNFTYSSDIITTNVNNYAELINSINKAKFTITPQYIIHLNKGYYNATKTIIWNSVSNSNLVINGNGITLNGQGTFQFIKIGINTSVTLNNIILINYTANSGGAVYNRGELTISNSIFSENSAQEDGGGAIFNDGELTITDSTFSENASQKCGGAIYNYEGMLTASESTFTKNTAQEDGGGAVYNSGELTISESTLNNNTAQGRSWSGGGAVCNSGELKITGSTLNNNTVHGEAWASGGGAVYNSGELTISDSTFSQNAAQEDGGGAVFNHGELTMSDSTLNRNTASEGGVIYNFGGEFTITDSTLNNNSAQNNGGAVYNRGELTIMESTLDNNTAQKDGGAVYIDSGNLKIYNCKFSTNKSPNNIILNNDFLQIQNTIFYNNQSKDIVLNAGDVANLGIFNGEFKENNIEKSVLCNDGKFCIIEKTIFQNNISDNKMNIINKSELTLSNPKINDKGKSIQNQKYILIRNSPPELENIICGEGSLEIDEKLIPQGENFDFGYLDAKIHESNTKKIILDHDITLENYEIYFYEGGIELDIDNLIIDGKGKTINGSHKSRIFIITGKNITLKNIIFKNGHSYKNYDNPLNTSGGAIKINCANDITIENCEFIDNASEKNGGAIYNFRSELTITDSTLTGNTAQAAGAAIYNAEKIQGGVISGGKSIITDCKIDDLHNVFGDCEFRIRKNNYLNKLKPNTEEGFPQVKTANDLETFKRLVENNYKNIRLGSDLSIGEIEISANDMTIDGNGHTIYGSGNEGIFIVTGKNITFKNITFSGGQCTGGGRERNNFTAAEVNFYYYGGAIYVQRSGECTCINCNFENNVVGNEERSKLPNERVNVWYESRGGAIYSKGTCMLISCHFKNNSAISGSNDDCLGCTEVIIVDERE